MRDGSKISEEGSALARLRSDGNVRPRSALSSVRAKLVRLISARDGVLESLDELAAPDDPSWNEINAWLERSASVIDAAQSELASSVVLLGRHPSPKP